MGQAVGAPIVLDRRRRSVAAIVARHADARRPFIVSRHPAGGAFAATDDTVVCRADWTRTRVGPDETVLITYLPLGGGSSAGSNTGKQIGGAVAMLALLALAPYAAPALVGAGSALTGTLLSAGAYAGAVAAVQAGLVVGGAYAISLATKAKANDTTDTDSRSVYGVSGGGNLPRPGDRIPVGYGRFWSSPDLTQPDYTVYDGDDVLLYKRMTLGLGEYEVHEIQVGTESASRLWTAEDGIRAPFDTPDTAVEIIAPGGTSTLVPGSVYSHPGVSSIELPRPEDTPAYSGPWAVCEVGTTTSKIQLDYELPQGVANNGGSEPFAGNWSLKFEYAPCDEDDVPTGPWVTLLEDGASVYSTRALRYTKYVTVPDGRYLVRGRNMQPYWDKGINTIIWSGLRAHFPDTVTRPHVTEIAVRIRSGKQLGVTAFGQLYVRATRKLPVWDGTAWATEATRKCVWAYHDVLTSSYGGALDPSLVDVDTLAGYAGSLSEHDTYDGVIRGPVSVWEAAAVVLGPMRAEPAVIGSLWSLVRDEPKAVRRHVFSRRQIKRGSSQVEVQIARDEGAADVIVEYSPDADPRRTRETRVTYGAASLTPTRMKVEGVTTWSHANHIARWKAAAGYYRRQKRTFSCDRMGRLVGRGDPILADMWFLDRGSSRTGGVMARSGTTLTLDTPMDQGGTLYAYLRDRRGREWGPVAVTIPDAEAPHVVTLDSDDVAAVEAAYGQSLASVVALDTQAPTTVLIGPLATVEQQYLVRRIAHQGRDSIEIEALVDAPEVWTAIGAAMPPEPVVPSIGDIRTPQYPTVAYVRAAAVAKGSALVMDWAIAAARGAASYVVRLSYDDGDTWEIVSEGLSLDGTYSIRHVEGGTVKLQAWAIGATGLPGPTVETTFGTFEATVKPGSLVDGLREHVTEELGREIAEIDFRTQRIAGAAADQDAANAIDKREVRVLVSAVKGSLQASITEVATIVETLGGTLTALYALALDVNGYVVGYYVVNDGTTSDFVVVSDNFKVAKPGVSGGDPVPVFAIGTVDGVTKLALRGDMLIDGCIIAAKIAANAITAGKIAADAITSDKIAANAITAAKVAAGALSVDKLTADAATLNLNVIGNATTVSIAHPYSTSNFETTYDKAFYWSAGSFTPERGNVMIAISVETAINTSTYKANFTVRFYLRIYAASTLVIEIDIGARNQDYFYSVGIISGALLKRLTIGTAYTFEIWKQVTANSAYNTGGQVIENLTTYPGMALFEPRNVV
ncbi:hypothetical protein CH341_07730 [Rhodoplanes roseus]|uniref:Tip attachment protein J central straight fiber domain-containing protein n=3 Tax=Rhodoplanes TaxID=29407 RepID=A0A327LAE2_9BRAD|nr:hypothetical protein CH341_07730 [Rhodoplanes roseus]